MPLNISFIHIIEGCYETINYLKIIFIKKVNFTIIKKFIKNYVLYYYNIPIKLKVNKSPENKKEIVKTYFILNIIRSIKPA